MSAWFDQHEVFLFWAGAVSVVMFLGTLAALPVVIVRMPADYFVRRRERRFLHGRHPIVRCAGLAAKNVLGLALVVLGVAMLVLPGQGILTILVGVVLVDFPGKRALQLRLVRRPRVLAAMNWIRAKAGRPPMMVEPPSGPAADGPGRSP